MGEAVDKKLIEFLNKNNAVLLENTEDYIKIGVTSEDPYFIDTLKAYTKKRIITQNITDSEAFVNYNALDNKKDESKLASEAPIVKLVNEIIEEAIKKSATDIHIEPFENISIVKYRIDGILHKVKEIPIYLHSAIVSRIKILSKLDIAEKRLPQDGKFSFKIGNLEYDIRVSTLPTVWGETVVLRLLSKGNVDIDLDKLGFSKEHLKIIKELIRVSHGMILVTGPTGSGKTTTLYAMLKLMNDGTKKIVTVEDPVEYTIPGITQVQVNEKIGLTFSKTLRSILRQDPDIIMIGEIRDKDTADIAVRAALTGHLVLATLHTNDSISAFTRLINIGVENFLVASAVVGILSQRLVRRICNACKESYKPSTLEKGIMEKFGFRDVQKLYRGRGCSACNYTGFKGRTVIAEVLVNNEEIRDNILSNFNQSKLENIAKSNGWKPLIVDGINKAIQGITTLEEVLRVVNLLA